MNFLNRALENGLRLTGGQDSLGFLFLYELLTDTLRVRVLSDDRPYYLASLLVRHLNPSDWQNRSELMCVLRILTAHDWAYCMQFPKYKDDRRLRVSDLCTPLARRHMSPVLPSIPLWHQRLRL